jgi:hypothetical protein
MGDLESNIYMYITCDIIMISHGISLVNPMKIMKNHHHSLTPP